MVYIELNDGESVTIAKNHDKKSKPLRDCYTIMRRGDALMIREFGETE